MGSYINGQIIIYPMYGQISYSCCLSKAVKLKLGHNPKIFLVIIMRLTEKEIAEHVMRPTKVIPASLVKTRCA